MSPGKPKRMDGYIRVSRVGTRDTEAENYITEAIQREKIETWAKLRDVEIAKWHIDRDQSGSKLTRPGFDACMARIAAGKTDGIVVAQIDRLSRADVADALMIVRQIHDDYNGTLAAVDLGIDPTTEVGEMLLTVLLALARMQWRRYATAWATSKEKAIRRGVHVGSTPVGYLRDTDGRLVPDPVAAPVIREAYKIVAAKGLRAGVEYLQSVKLTSPRRHPKSKAIGVERTWDANVVRRTLLRRTYLGEISNGAVTVTNDHAHEALVDLATWTAACQRIRGVKLKRRPTGEFVLTHKVLCASCGGGLVGDHGRPNARSYRCRRNAKRSVQRGEEAACAAPVKTMAEPLEEYVRAALLHYVATTRPADVVTLVAAADQGEVEAAESVLKSAELARDRDATDIRLREIMGDASFYERMETHAAAVAEAQEQYEAAVEESQAELTWPLTDEIATAPIDELPGLLERCDIIVRVAPGRGNLAARVTLEPKGN